MKLEELSFLLQLILAEAFKAGWEHRNKRDAAQSVYGPDLEAQHYARNRLTQFT